MGLNLYQSVQEFLLWETNPLPQAKLGAPGSLEQSFHDLMLWGGIIAFLVLALFIVKKAFRWGAQSRIRSLERPLGISMDDLEAMNQTGSPLG